MKPQQWKTLPPSSRQLGPAHSTLHMPRVHSKESMLQTFMVTAYTLGLALKTGFCALGEGPRAKWLRLELGSTEGRRTKIWFAQHEMKSWHRKMPYTAFAQLLPFTSILGWSIRANGALALFALSCFLTANLAVIFLHLSLNVLLVRRRRMGTKLGCVSHCICRSLYTLEAGVSLMHMTQFISHETSHTPPKL